MKKNWATYLEQVDFEREFEKDKTRLLILLILEILLIGLTLFIQEYLRPNRIFPSKMGIFLMGVLPSFFGSMAYVFILFIFYKLVQGHYQRFRLWSALLFANLFTVLGLGLWEFIRLVIRPFDWWDVLASLIGGLFSTLLILAMYLPKNSPKSSTKSRAFDP